MTDQPKTLTIVRHLMIHGRVQGVYYRASAQSEAIRLQLQGWVRNRHHGGVEALVCGPRAAVETFIEWAGLGPPGARVDRIEITVAEAPPPGPFEVRSTK